MNGRIYDPTLGRFLQANPIIQTPNDSQSYNRYAYVMNNPLTLTDPSGYSWLSKMRKKILKPIIAVVIAYYTYDFTLTSLAKTTTISTSVGTISATYATTGAYIDAGAAAGFVGGGIATGSLRGALTGAVAGAFGGWGSTFATTTIGGATASMAVSGAGGCLAGEMSGGSYGKGAQMAVLAQALKVSMDNFSGSQSSWATSEGDAVIKADGNLKLQMIKDGSNVDWVNDAVNNTGNAITVSDPQYAHLVGKTVYEARRILGTEFNSAISFGALGGTVSEANSMLSWSSQNIPGVRSASVFHDQFAGITGRAMGIEGSLSGLAWTVGTIPYAFYAQYSALGLRNYDYYYKNLQD